jgi:SAM-dependent methyltransferase
MNEAASNESGSTESDYGFTYAERQLARSRHPLRKLIKGFYLRNLLTDVVGPTIDFGCGSGQILERLPAGSIGFEANKHLVSALSKRGLDARLYEPEIDQLNFKDIPVGQFNTLIMSHVLEHFDDAARGLKKILDSCKRLAIKRVIIVVPGKKGYSFDDTHLTFVDRAYIDASNLTQYNGFVASQFSYFPFNIAKIGDYFTFHEFKIIFDDV